MNFPYVRMTGAAVTKEEFAVRKEDKHGISIANEKAMGRS